MRYEIAKEKLTPTNRDSLILTKEVIKTWNVENLESLIGALHDAAALAVLLGHHPASVVPNLIHLTLVQQELSNGSKVLDLNFSQSETT